MSFIATATVSANPMSPPLGLDREGQSQKMQKLTHCPITRDHPGDGCQKLTHCPITRDHSGGGCQDGRRQDGGLSGGQGGG